MKYIKNSAIILAAGMLALSACSDDKTLNPGNPVMDLNGSLGSTFFGDTLRFEVKASDADVPLSTVKAFLYFGSELVGEDVVRTKVSGETYPIKIYVPYYANIPDANATLNLQLQNINFTITEETYSVAVSHKDYPYLTLRTDGGEEYRMEKQSMYTYAVTDEFPQKVNAKIYAPENEDGSQIVFGYETSEIKVGASNYIPFTSASAGSYEISFNTYTMEGAPFASMFIDGNQLEPIGNNQYSIDLTLSRGDTLNPEGFPNFEEWWLNPDYLQLNADGSLQFLGNDGGYRFIADLDKQYFRIDRLIDGALATLNTDGSGGVWILGEGIGYPNLGNAPGWNEGRGICMALKSEKVYYLTLVAGVNINARSINFKFYGQDGWGTELTNKELTSQTDLIMVGDGTNGSDPGNLFYADGVELQDHGIYELTLDMTGGMNNAILTFEMKGEAQFEEKPVYINGAKMKTSDNSSYSLITNLSQGDKLDFSGNVNISDIYLDPDYFNAEGGSISFNPIGGTYNVVLDLAKGTLGAYMVDSAGSDLILKEDGSGALWLMGWGTGSPSQDYQFGWDPGLAYCLAQVAPKVYQFTGTAGPESDSKPGDRFRFDYLSFKFFWQNGWGGEFNDSDYVLDMIGQTSSLIQNTGNFELAPGVNLVEGETYRLTIDLTAGVSNGTINFEKL